MAERLKLTITQVKDVQRVGEKQKEKLTFLARGEDGKELSFSTMRTSLFDAIRNNKEIEADVEVTEKDTYINRYVSQVYVDGKAIATEGKWQGGGRQWGGKSPEEIASIERQVAVKAVVDLLIAGNLPDDSPEVLGMRVWLCTHLGVGARAPKSEEETLPDKPQDNVKEPKDEPRGERVRWQAFLKECKRYGWGPKHVNEIGAWFKDNPPHLRWGELTAEAQEQAIARMSQMCEEKEE